MFQLGTAQPWADPCDSQTFLHQNNNFKRLRLNASRTWLHGLTASLATRGLDVADRAGLAGRGNNDAIRAKHEASWARKAVGGSTHAFQSQHTKYVEIQVNKEHFHPELGWK